ncbi:MAG: SGNH/GDSL hydrolase family protein [SAR324 cluster bacterium]|nr:SGNH/GDSL hydrolase family protein [SAR324 cluster bacterium]
MIRAVYYQIKAPYYLGLEQVFVELNTQFVKWKVKNQIGTENLPTREQFFKEESQRNVLKGALQEYPILFKRFYEICKKNNVKLILLYIPPEEGSQSIAYDLFKTLGAQYELPFIDLIENFKEYPQMAVYNTVDGHPNAFGNYLVAKKLQGFLKNNLVSRQSKSFNNQERPPFLGAMTPKKTNIYSYTPKSPFWVTINHQGFRRTEEVEFPKKKNITRILTIGDSFTFGHGVNDNDTYQHFLEKMLDNVEVINAASPAMTILHELIYLTRRGQYAEPDIIILQVLDNDLHELIPRMKEIFLLKKGHEFDYAPTTSTKD